MINYKKSAAGGFDDNGTGWTFYIHFSR